jgi:hypothetical protein
MILRTLLMALFFGILICQTASAQKKPRYQSEKLHQRYEEDKQKEQEEALKRQPTSVVDIPKITFLLPGFSYEKAIGNFQTLHAYALYNLYSYSRSSGETINTSYYFDPTFMLSYRYYCNYKRRNNLGRVTERNTMNYIGPYAQVFYSKTPVGTNAYENEKRRPVYSYGFLYGLQRNYNSRLSLDINFGLGVIAANTTYYNSFTRSVMKGNRTQLALPGQITLGFWLGKK